MQIYFDPAGEVPPSWLRALQGHETKFQGHDRDWTLKNTGNEPLLRLNHAPSHPNDDPSTRDSPIHTKKTSFVRILPYYSSASPPPVHPSLHTPDRHDVSYLSHIRRTCRRARRRARWIRRCVLRLRSTFTHHSPPPPSPPSNAGLGILGYPMTENLIKAGYVRLRIPTTHRPPNRSSLAPPDSRPT